MTASSSPAPRRVLLVWMTGAGKTTVGRSLARRFGWRCVDSDDEVEALAAVVDRVAKKVRHLVQQATA